MEDIGEGERTITEVNTPNSILKDYYGSTNKDRAWEEEWKGNGHIGQWKNFTGESTDGRSQFGVCRM